MCCFPLDFTSITSVKVMRDGDGDGKCQEEDGKWVPCPPGVVTGTRLRNGKPLGQTVGQITQQVSKPTRDYTTERRKRAAEKADAIAKAAKTKVNPEKQAAARKFKPQTLIRDLQRMSPEEQKTKFGELFNHELIGISGAKYRTVVSEISIGRDAKYPEIRIAGSIFDADGNRVGKFSRMLNIPENRDPWITHIAMTISENHRKDGIASALNAVNETIYKELGFNQIRTLGVSGGDMKGATHWPRNGFTWTNSQAKSKFLTTITELLDKAETSDKTLKKYFTDRREYEILKELATAAQNQPFNDPNSITPADLLHFKGAEEWFKNQNIQIPYMRMI